MNTLTPPSPAGSPANTITSDVVATLNSLRAFKGEVEGVFVRLGDGLQRILDKVEGLRADLDCTVKKIKGDHGDSIVEYIDVLEKKTSERFSANSDLIKFSIDLMQQNVEKLSAIEKLNSTFVAIGARMNAVAIYFSIETSRSAAASTVFATYGSDIRSLFSEMIGVVEKIGQEVSRNNQNQIEAIESVSHDYESVVKDSRASIEQSYAAITHISTVSMETLERVTQYFSLLGRSVARILTAIQIGDITRQQLEHIVAALEETADAGERREPIDVDRARLVALQYAQLKHVRREIADAHATIDEAVAQIGAAFGVLAADITDLVSGARGAAGAHDWVSELTGEMEKMWRLERAGARVIDRTLATMDNAFGSSQSLKNHVDRIAVSNRRLSMEAYNARILSMRLGDEGRSLTTLAKEVSEMSGTAKAYMNGVTAIVSGIIDVAEQAVRRIEVMRRGFGSASDYDQAGNTARTDLDDLERQTGQFAKMTLEACDNAKALNVEVGFIEEGVKALGSLRTRLDGSLETLGAVVTAVDGLFGDALGQEWKTDEDMADRYTMENERLIHRQLAMGGAPSDATLDSSVARRQEMTVSEEDMGENVELF